MNQLYYNDNLDVLESLKDNSVDLVYADPPFNTGKNWGAFDDQWENGLIGYLDFMRPRIEQIHRILKNTGSFYLHCDPRTSHYLKIMLDEIFGIKQFRNEIVWRKYGGRKNNATRKFSTQHDSIFLYAKTDNAFFKPFYVPISEKEVETAYKHTDEKGRKYRYSAGRHYQLTGEQRKIYLDGQPGAAIGSLWVEDGLQLNTSSKERLNYPTQKPLALLERIIKASSNEGSIVLDPFCGSGTTLDAAHLLDRQWIGIDKGQQAIETTTMRLTTQHGILPNDNYELIGEISDLKLPKIKNATPQQIKLF